MDSQEDYKPTYGKVFNVLFHIGVIINVLLVTWLYLIFFGVI
jgi:hypothetical protein